MTGIRRGGVSEQPPYNLLDRRIENELVPLCQKYGLAILPWSPLARGILAGRYAGKTAFPEGSRASRWEFFQARITRQGLEVADAVGKMAAERGMTISQLSLLWIKDQPGITSPIIGPRTLEHLEDALPLLTTRNSPTLIGHFSTPWCTPATPWPISLIPMNG